MTQRSLSQNIDDIIIYDSTYAFNIHGALPSLVGRFHIYGTKKDDEKISIYNIKLLNMGDSSLFQEIIDTSDTFNFWEKIQIADFNFDGFKDISLVMSRDAIGQAQFDYWIFNPQKNQYELNNEFSGLLACEVDLDSTKKTISSTCRGGCGGMCFTSSVYRIEGNDLVLIEETNAEQEVTDDKWRIKVTTQKLIDGKMKITNVQYQDE